VKRLARDKHSGFSGTLINYDRKKFYKIDPRMELERKTE
jgi:hypothetical protein